MPRARLLHPEFARHEGLAELSHSHRLLFAMLPMIADREGLIEDRPRRIKADLFPYDQTTAESVDSMLADLETAGFLVRYSVSERACIQIPGFKRWQKPHQREKASELPKPPSRGTPKANLRHANGSPSGLALGAPRVSSEASLPPDPVSVSDPVSDPVSDAGKGSPAASPKAPPPPTTGFSEDQQKLLAYLRRDWPEIHEPERSVSAWPDAYPGMDLLAQARLARAHLAASGEKREVPAAYLNGWFKREARGPPSEKHNGRQNHAGGSTVPGVAETEARLARDRAKPRSTPEGRAAAFAKLPPGLRPKS